MKVFGFLVCYPLTQGVRIIGRARAQHRHGFHTRTCVGGWREESCSMGACEGLFSFPVSIGGLEFSSSTTEVQGFVFYPPLHPLSPELVLTETTRCCCSRCVCVGVNPALITAERLPHWLMVFLPSTSPPIYVHLYTHIACCLWLYTTSLSPSLLPLPCLHLHRSAWLESSYRLLITVCARCAVSPPNTTAACFGRHQSVGVSFHGD